MLCLRSVRFRFDFESFFVAGALLLTCFFDFAARLAGTSFTELAPFPVPEEAKGRR
jgi:hypothetical protein